MLDTIHIFMVQSNMRVSLFPAGKTEPVTEADKQVEDAYLKVEVG